MATELEYEGLRKAYDLLLKGFESAEESRAQLKQQVRALEQQVAQLTEASVPSMVQRIEAALRQEPPDLDFIAANAPPWLDYCCRKIRGLRTQLKQRDFTIKQLELERETKP